MLKFMMNTSCLCIWALGIAATMLSSTITIATIYNKGDLNIEAKVFLLLSGAIGALAGVLGPYSINGDPNQHINPDEKFFLSIDRLCVILITLNCIILIIAVLHSIIYNYKIDNNTYMVLSASIGALASVIVPRTDANKSVAK